METQLVLFIITSFVLIITPGQDMILVMSKSVAQGAKAGIATAAGISVGLLGHTVLAAFGLGALLRTSEIFFICIKIFGAIYLFYLGFKLLQTKEDTLVLSNEPISTLKSLFFQGAISNISNPKIAIFYFAFLPQFVPANSGNPTFMLLFLGSLFAFITFLVKAPIGYGAGSLSKWLRAKPSVQLWINRVSGGILVALGIKLAFEKRI